MTRAVLSLWLLACLAGIGFAEEGESAGTVEPSPILDSYAFRVMNGHAPSRSIEYVSFGPRATFDVLGFLPEIYGQRVRLAVELLGSVIDKKGTKHELAFNPLLLDYRYDTGGTFVPYLELGEGVLWTTLRYVSLGGKWQFASQIGVGTHVFLIPDLALSVGYRFRHISNAGLTGNDDENDLNHGLNTHFVILGISRFPGRGEVAAAPESSPVP